jgi:heme-degrading monooxygenase HmoA
VRGPIQHLVLFHFPRALSEQEEGEMFGRVRAWPEQIGGFRRLRFGRDASGRSRGYDYALMVEFETAEDMERYTPHPVHRAFADWVHARGSDEVVVDYPVHLDTVIVGD